MIDVDKIISIISLKGPVIPTDLKSYTNYDTIFLGAILSDLASKGKLKITHVKKGGSPFYYIKDQEEKLQSLNGYLNEKDRLAYELLKEKKFLKDDELTPLQRVCMRTIQDYAVPLEIKAGDSVSLYWKWYLFDNSEIVNILKKEYESKLNIGNQFNNDVEKLPNKINKEKVSKPKKVLDAVSESNDNADVLDIQNKIHKKTNEIISDKANSNEDQDVEPSKLKINKETEFIKDNLYLKTITFLSHNSITPLDINIIRKEKEISGKASVLCNIGNIMFYFLVKNKKTCNHNDVNDALVKAQQYHLPLLFIYTGAMTKKAQEIYNNSFGNVICKKLAVNDEIYI